MINNILRVMIYFIIFLSLQIFVLNNLHFLRLDTHFIYIYILLKMPIGTSPVKLLLLSFVTGFIVDIFSNTVGMHAAACTLIAFLREPFIHLLVGKDVPEGSVPTFNSLGRGTFIRYVLGFTAVHHIALFLIESLTFFDPFYLVLRIMASICLTALLIFVAESFNLNITTYNE